MLYDLAADDVTGDVATAVQRAARERYLATRIDRGDLLVEVVRSLSELDAPAADFELAVDRLLPARVRARDWEGIAASRDAVPARAGEAAEHLAYVLSLAGVESDGDSQDTILSAVRSRSVPDFFGLAARSAAGEVGEFVDRSAALETGWYWSAPAVTDRTAADSALRGLGGPTDRG